MTGIVKAVTKKLEPEARSFQNSCRRLLNHFELQRSYMEQMLGETLLEILASICLTVLFSHRYICQPLRVQKNYFKSRFHGVTQVLLA